jgi:hypothetical protein
MREFILKESDVSEEETLEHCLTVIQGLLDMDDFDQAYKYLYAYLKMAIKQEKEKVYKELIEDIRKIY